MADDTQLTMDESPGKRRLWIIIAVVVALITVVGAGIGWWLSRDNTAPAPIADPPAPKTPSVAQNTLYVSLPRAFVFNVRGDERDRLVQIKVQLITHSAASEDLAKQHIPLIEGTLLQVFSAATAEQLSSAQGKAGIRQRSLQKVQEALKMLTGSTVVDQVLFTGFVMQ